MAKTAEFTMKRSCFRCRANEFHNECSLGFRCHNYTPQERCPKPKTYKQLMDSENIELYRQANKK